MENISPEKNTNRELAVVLFADIQGYTSLMQNDEANASILLRRFQQQMSENVTTYQGRIVNFYGDGALCIFKDAIQAVYCGMNLQSIFNTTPTIPVRIGIHSGMVTFDQDKAYGHSINIASRIESLGQPQSVLVSKTVYQQVLDQKDIELASLGNFNFKNIDYPIEVFAIKNKGFIVPKRKEIKGKLAQPNYKKQSKWIIPLLILGTLLSVFATWFFTKQSYDSPLSKEIREQRVGVMIFENQTMNSELDAFGKMIADWVTRGLMETGEANVVTNLQNQLITNNSATGNNNVLTKTDQADILLQGHYYIQENKLLIHANIVSTKTGEVLHAVKSIKGSQNDLMQLLQQLTQEVLGYWAVKKEKRFLQNPPRYEAYQEWEKGEAAYTQDFKKAERHMIKAFQLDTTFYAPLLKLYTLYVNNGKIQSQDSLITFMDQRTANFTNWELLRYEYLKARDKGQWLKAAQLAKERYQLDKNDEVANSNAGSKYIYANQPKEGIEILNDFNDQFLQKDQKIGLREGYKAMGYFRLGKYKEVLKMTEDNGYSKTNTIFARYFLKALIRLNKMEMVSQQLSFYEQKGVYTHSGKRVKQDVLLKYICDELFLLGRTKDLERYVSLLKKFIEEHKEEINYSQRMGHVHWYLGDYSKALYWWQQENIKDKDPGKLMKFHARQGACYAAQGDTLNAQIQTDSIFSVNYSEPLYKGYPHYYKARIEVILGKKEDAMFSLDKAVNNGRRFSWDTYQEDIFLKSLWGYPPFEGFVKPKG